MLLHRLEYRKNGIWSVETVREHKQTAYAHGDSCPGTACLHAQLKVWSFSELFTGFFSGLKAKRSNWLKTMRKEKSADFLIFPDYFCKVFTFFAVRAWSQLCTRIWLILNPVCHQPNCLVPCFSKVSYNSKHTLFLEQLFTYFLSTSEKLTVKPWLLT